MYILYNTYRFPSDKDAGDALETKEKRGGDFSSVPGALFPRSVRRFRGYGPAASPASRSVRKATEVFASLRCNKRCGGPWTTSPSCFTDTGRVVIVANLLASRRGERRQSHGSALLLVTE
jgi:hypothetical protein